MRHLAARPAKSRADACLFVAEAGSEGQGAGGADMALEDAKRDVDGAFTREGLRGLAYEKRLSRARPVSCAAAITKDLAGVDLAVTGIAFDQAVTNRPGTRLGPRAIREASLLQPYDPPYGWNGFSPLERFAIADYGDMAFDYAHTPDVPARIEAHVSGILAAGAGCITLGGGSFHHVADPARACGETRAARADPGRCPYRHLAR